MIELDIQECCVEEPDKYLADDIVIIISTFARYENCRICENIV